jgi:predicted nucleotidyltransferase
MSDIRPADLADRVSGRAFARLRAFRRAAERRLPGRVSRVVLFGSRARGDAARASDYDVAVFVRGLEDHRAATRVLVDAAYPHVLAGFHILPIAVPADFLDMRSRQPLAASIARDGVAIP